jgi:aryl-alcohol dehydrogenase-like predicted oxidoreductase
MSELQLGGTFTLGDRQVHRMGFGAMRLSGPQIFGPPSDPAEAAQVLRAAIEAGVDHIDTSDFYGPHFTNQLIRETLHPYRDSLVIVTKVGARRNANAAWLPALAPEQIRSAVEDNLRNLGLDAMEVVNLRMGTGKQAPFAAPIAQPFETLLELQREGKVKHIGLSNIVPSQLEEGLKLGTIACVQNSYGVLNRGDDELLETCADRGIAFVPFFPLGGFQPYQSSVLDEIAKELDATAMQVALAWLLHGPENILLIPGTSKVAHLKENLAAAGLTLSAEQLKRLDALPA